MTNKIRNTKEYRQFRKEVLERDNYICQECGSKENPEVHHIKALFEYPELAYEITNGKTLCHECHTKTDSYFIPKYHKTKKIQKGEIKIKVRISEEHALIIEKIAEELKVSVNDAYKMVIKAGIKTFI